MENVPDSGGTGDWKVCSGAVLPSWASAEDPPSPFAFPASQAEFEAKCGFEGMPRARGEVSNWIYPCMSVPQHAAPLC